MTIFQASSAAIVLAFALLTSACGAAEVDAIGSDPRAQRLTIYTARDKDEVTSVVELFVQKYPQYHGRVNVITLSAQDALTRLRAEKDNPQAGFLWGGTQQGLEQAAAEGLLAPSHPDHADLIDRSRKDPRGRWYAEMLLPEVIVYNRERMTPDQAPRDWDDLVTPQFKGKVLVRDVMASGTMRTIFSAMIFRQYAATGSPEAGYAWLRRLDANTVNYAANPDDMYFKLDRGVGVVTLWNLQDVLIQVHKNHRPWSYVIPEAGAPVLLDGVGVVSNPRSQRAADDFENFLLDPALQLQLARDYYQIPAISLGDNARAEWLAKLTVKELPIDWQVMSHSQAEWMGYWSQHIQGNGSR
ncbi:MAG TPA: extracellular solute-binding protein [Vicinamibacterales bacterium]|nr:extracellular solute-binding protein [Vicinamibacterales bacterium]